MEGNIDPVVEKLKEKEVETIILTGCGTSYYAGISASMLLNILTDIKGFAIPASEVNYFTFKAFENKTAVISLSRSGETTETVLANRRAKKLGFLTIGITNNPTSTLAKEADYSIYLDIGEEKSIVMTKTFSSLLLVSMLVAIKLADLKQNAIGQKLLEEIHKIPDIATSILKKKDEIEKMATDFVRYNHFVVLGTGPNYGVALEGALKIKETNYIATEAFSTLEFRHGPMAMVDEKLVVIGLIPESKRYNDEIAVINEIADRGGRILLVTNAKAEKVPNRFVIDFPSLHEYLTPIINIIPMQLLAFCMCVKRGYNPDKPRHLTKVVKLKKEE